MPRPHLRRREPVGRVSGTRRFLDRIPWWSATPEGRLHRYRQGDPTRRARLVTLSRVGRGRAFNRSFSLSSHLCARFLLRRSRGVLRRRLGGPPTTATTHAGSSDGQAPKSPPQAGHRAVSVGAEAQRSRPVCPADRWGGESPSLSIRRPRAIVSLTSHGGGGVRLEIVGNA